MACINHHQQGWHRGPGHSCSLCLTLYSAPSDPTHRPPGAKGRPLAQSLPSSGPCLPTWSSHSHPFATQEIVPKTPDVTRLRGSGRENSICGPDVFSLACPACFQKPHQHLNIEREHRNLAFLKNWKISPSRAAWQQFIGARGSCPRFWGFGHPPAASAPLLLVTTLRPGPGAVCLWAATACFFHAEKSISATLSQKRREEK